MIPFESGVDDDGIGWRARTSVAMKKTSSGSCDASFAACVDENDDDDFGTHSCLRKSENHCQTCL